VLLLLLLQHMMTSTHDLKVASCALLAAAHGSSKVRTEGAVVGSSSSRLAWQQWLS